MQIAHVTAPQRLSLLHAYQSFNDAYNVLVTGEDDRSDAHLRASRAVATRGVEQLLAGLSRPGQVRRENITFAVDTARAGLAALEIALVSLPGTDKHEAAMRAVFGSFDTVAERLSNDLDLPTG